MREPPHLNIQVPNVAFHPTAACKHIGDIQGVTLRWGSMGKSETIRNREICFEELCRRNYRQGELHSQKRCIKV